MTDDFTMVPLSELCSLSGRNSDYFRTTDYVNENEGIVAFTPNNVQNNRINYEGVIYLSRSCYERSNSGTIKNGDILFVKYSNPGTPYKSAVVNNLPEDNIYIINPSFILLYNIKCSPEYLKLVLDSDKFQAVLRSEARGNMHAINATSIAKIPVPLPPLEKQLQLAGTLSNYRDKNDELISLLQQEIDHRQKVFQHYMNRSLWAED